MVKPYSQWYTNEFQIGSFDAATSVQSFTFSIFEQSLLLVVSGWIESAPGVNERGSITLPTVAK